MLLKATISKTSQNVVFIPVVQQEHRFQLMLTKENEIEIQPIRYILENWRGTISAISFIILKSGVN